MNSRFIATTVVVTILIASVGFAQTAMDSELLPPNAKPGECYTRVFVPPTYKTVTETVLKKAESTKIEVVPAKYETVEETVITKEASTKLKQIPAKYGKESEKVLVTAASRVWRTSMSGGTASDALLEAARKGGINLAGASPGDCFHEHYVAPKYETVTDQVLRKAESTRIEVIPAKYETVEETVMTKEASTRLKKVPATFKWEEEKILVEPARTEWKKGRGLVEKLDNATGEIMCLIEIPAVYKTVRKQVVDQSARTETIKIPAEYKTVKVRKLVQPAGEKTIVIPAEYRTVTSKKMVADGKFVWHEIQNTELPASTRTGNQICLTETPEKYRTDTKTVVVQPARTETIEIPAEYKQVKVRKVVKPASERTIVIPAEYQEVTKTQKVSDGYLEWRWVLCETNMTHGAISKIQSALKKAGFYSGPVDGLYGNLTARALRKFQEGKGIATGGITKESLESLGVSL